MAYGNPRYYSSMLDRFTIRVLSGTILRGFEPRPLIELFRLLKIPRIAPPRFSRSGVYRDRSNGRRGIRTPLHSTRSSVRLVSFRLGPRWSSFTGSIGPSFGGRFFTFMFGGSLVRVSRTSYCGVRN